MEEIADGSGMNGVTRDSILGSALGDDVGLAVGSAVGELVGASVGEDVSGKKLTTSTTSPSAILTEAI